MNYSRAAFEQELAAIRLGDIRRWLGQRGNLPVYALVNFALCKPEAVVDLCQAHGLELFGLFENTPEEEHAAIGPQLIALTHAPDPKWLETLAQQCAASDALSFIVSPQPMFQLVEHLQSWFDGVLEDESGVLVRYFDSRIGFELIGLLAPEERNAFLAPMRFWAGWNGTFAPTVMQGQARRTAPPRALPLPIDKALRQSIAHISLANLLLGLITEEDVEDGELDHIAPLLQRHIAQRQLAQLQAAGLQDWADQRFWVGMGLRINPMLGDVETGRAWLFKAKQEETTLPSLLVDQPEELWERAKARAPQSLSEVAQKLLASLNAQPQKLAMTP